MGNVDINQEIPDNGCTTGVINILRHTQNQDLYASHSSSSYFVVFDQHRPPTPFMNRHISEYLNTYYNFFATDSVTCDSLPPLYTWLKIFSATSTGIFFLPDPYIFDYLVIRHILLTATTPTLTELTYRQLLPIHT